MTVRLAQLVKQLTKDPKFEGSDPALAENGKKVLSTVFHQM